MTVPNQDCQAFSGELEVTLKYRICYLSPLPSNSPGVGVKLRIDQIISAIRELDFVDLHIWSPDPTHEDTTHAMRNTVVSTCADLVVAGLATITTYLPRTFSAPVRYQLFNWLRQIKPDLVVVSHPTFTALIPTLVRTGYNIVIDTYNVEESIAHQMVRTVNKPQELAHWLCQYAVFHRMEHTLLARAKEVWAASEQDVNQFNHVLRDRASVVLVPNVIDSASYIPTDHAEPYSVGFAANYGYLPNEIAAEQLLLKIMPELRVTIPEARLYLIGRTPSKRLCDLAAETPNVVVTGTVEDTRPWIDRCAVLVAPIEHGSGTRLKILEGLAMAKPMVSTAKGCEGIAVQDGVHLLVRDVPSFAEAIASLLANPGDAQAMAQRGKILVAEQYSAKRLQMILGERLSSLLFVDAP